MVGRAGGGLRRVGWGLVRSDLVKSSRLQVGTAKVGSFSISSYQNGSP